MIDGVSTKVCRTCRRERHVQRFYATSRTGYHPDCKECQSAKSRKKRKDEQFRVELLEAVARVSRLYVTEKDTTEGWEDLRHALARLDAWERDSAPTVKASDMGLRTKRDG